MERESFNAQVQTARRHVRAGNFKKAIPEFERVVRQEPGELRIRLELADAYARSEEPAKAVEQLLDVAKRYERDGFGLKAMGCYLQVQRLVPRHPDATRALGVYYAEHALYDEAAQSFADALAGAKSEADRLDTIQKLLSFDTDNLADRLRLAEAYSAQGQLGDAARELRAVADILEHRAGDQDYPRIAERLLYHQPDDATVSERLAAVYVAHDEPQRALPKLKKAFEARPERLEVLSLLTEAFTQLGQVHKAIAILKEMARLYDSGGLIHERDECWQRVLNLDPNDPQAREQLHAASQDAVGQTFEVPLHPAPPPRRRVPDFDDDEEVGFDGIAETTLVDAAKVSQEAQDEIGLGLNLSAHVAASPELDEELQELDFYLSSDLWTEAAAHLKGLEARFGAAHPLIAARAERLRAEKAKQSN